MVHVMFSFWQHASSLKEIYRYHPSPVLQCHFQWKGGGARWIHCSTCPASLSPNSGSIQLLQFAHSSSGRMWVSGRWSPHRTLHNKRDYSYQKNIEKCFQLCGWYFPNIFSIYFGVAMNHALLWSLPVPPCSSLEMLILNHHYCWCSYQQSAWFPHWSVRHTSYNIDMIPTLQYIERRWILSKIIGPCFGAKDQNLDKL